MPSVQACDIIIDIKPLFGHCGIVTGNFFGKSNQIPGGSQVLHATRDGVFEGQWSLGKAHCFRANNLNRTEAINIQKVAIEIKYSAEYGVARSIFKSWSGSSAFGSGSLQRLSKYRTRMQEDQGVLKNVYCSELVVLCYQLGLDIQQDHANWIDLDGKHTLPSTLKSWLERRPTRWSFVGYINDDSLVLSKQ